MPIWGIVGLVILGIILFLIACRIGIVGFFFEVLGTILGGSSGSSSSSGGSGFGGGSSGGGGSSDDW